MSLKMRPSDSLILQSEVRNKIYKILLVLPELKIDFEFNYEHYGDNDESHDEFNDERDQFDTEEDDKEADENAYVEPMPNHSKGLHIQMIRTCRQVASEATYNLYSSKKFTFDNMSKAVFFFDGLTYDKANMVKQISLEMNDVRHFQERMIPMILQDKFLTRKYDYVPAYQTGEANVMSISAPISTRHLRTSRHVRRSQRCGLLFPRS